MAEFFISCPSPFEDELAKEINEFWCYLIQMNSRPQASALSCRKSGQGGITLEAPEWLGFQINFYSKLAHRVLLRVKRFKVKDANRLFYQLREINWSPFFRSMSFDCEVACSMSRLSDERQVLDLAFKAWGLKPQSQGKVYIRIHEDECVVSVDTTGEHLHKRNLRKRQGEAPLRETIAAFCLRRMIRDTSANELQSIKLVDPMAGAGTFLLEGHQLYTPNFHRKYSFQNFPMTPQLLLSTQLSSNYPTHSTFGSYVARDVSAEMVEILKKNLDFLPVDSAVQDAMAESYPFPGRTWVVMNPPYGERLSGPHWKELLHRVSENYRPEKFGILLPSQFYVSSELSHGLRLKEKISLKNGGIPVNWVQYENPMSSTGCDNEIEEPRSEDLFD